MTPDQVAMEELDALRLDMAVAVHKIFDAAQSGMARLDAEGDKYFYVYGELKQLFCIVMEACAFEDLANQRINKLEQRLSGASPPASGDARLMNGPALHGHGLDQAAADALFADVHAPGA
jgi:hypothetical protein